MCVRERKSYISISEEILIITRNEVLNSSLNSNNIYNIFNGSSNKIIIIISHIPCLLNSSFSSTLKWLDPPGGTLKWLDLPGRTLVVGPTW